MTAMYDGILDGLRQLELGRQDKKSLIIISDGGDNASANHFRNVVDAAQSSRAILYTIGVFDDEDPDRNPGLLRRLAGMTGGMAYVPHLDQLEEVCRGIAKDIRNRYSIGYVPIRTSDKSAVRSLKVQITGAGNQRYVVHARTSYVLPARQ
jgi:Ca-activated chloride channel family protein